MLKYTLDISNFIVTSKTLFYLLSSILAQDLRSLLILPLPQPSTTIYITISFFITIFRSIYLPMYLSIYLPTYLPNGSLKELNICTLINLCLFVCT